MQFLYFLPGEVTVNEEVIGRYGLADRLRPGFSPRGCTPGIKGGKLCARGGPDVEEIKGMVAGMGPTEGVLFEGERQTWERVEEPGRPVYHLGWYTDARPTEADLKRPATTVGYAVELGNGERWIIPPARCYPEGSELPAALKLSADGGEVVEMLPDYRELFAEVSGFAEPWFAATLAALDGNAAGGDAEPDLPEMSLQTIIKLLGVNYRVGRPEVNVLGLVTKANRGQIALAAIDFPSFAQIVRERSGQEETVKNGVAVLEAG